ncbi:MAG: UDP-3-O-acyl-N-acetylglucosamine deacetylase [Deltaproteobacteria bacterium]|jgi:UDP-3-O-[3-hydroxymyristoyl] N-acetylglucosamine deacetylase|nr:UDP-3-O-acyl-N-acetylglucosamine deacetylase [Deltaproteobacteria bacterium]
MHYHQKTIKQKVQISGKGLHTNRQIDMTLCPGSINSGIWFLRTDKPGNKPVKVTSQNVSDTILATTVGQGPESVSTIEHFMSALGCLGINNLFIEINGPETPVFDGSSLPWIELLRNAGLRTLNSLRPYYAVRRPFEMTLGDKMIAMVPDHELVIDFTIDFPGFIQNQRKSFTFTENGFVSDISPARTFCLLSDVEKMQAAGKALGGGLDNAVVVSGNGIILNREGLRFPDECVRHKILDFYGDMTLAEAPILGRFTVVKSGHSLNHKFLATILNTPGLLELVTPTRVPGETYVSLVSPSPALNAAWAN